MVEVTKLLRFFIVYFAFCFVPVVQIYAGESGVVPSAATLQDTDTHSWEEYFHDIIGVEDYEDGVLDELFEHLCMLESSPLNINTVDFDELSLIPGLSIEQISDIIKYRDRYGEMRSIEELSLIESVDQPLRLFLSHFLVAAPIEKKGWIATAVNDSLRSSRWHGDVLSSLSVPLYERVGDRGAYLGGKYKYGVKVTGQYTSKIKYGIVAAQDAGEPFGKAGNRYGMDYYSFFVALKDLGRFSNITVGRYRVRYGMGLVQNNNYSFGKQSMMSVAGRSANVISPHSSRSEGNYFQGIAAAFQLSRDFTLSAFTSYRYLDATLNEDGTAATLITSGYHRTETEMGKKYNTVEMTSGGHVAYKHNAWHGGATFVYNWFNRTLAPSLSSLYRRFYPRGDAFWNASIDYGYTAPRFAFSGETAIDSCGNIATLNTIHWKANHDITLTAVQRFYSYRYTALHANAFSDGGKVQNENGAYLGLAWKMSRRLTLDAYTDFSYSAWPKYMIGRESYSWDNTVALTCKHRDWTWLARYRFRLRQRDDKNQDDALMNRYDHRLRISATRSSVSLTWRTQLDGSWLNTKYENNYGWMLSESATWKASRWLEVSGNAAYFHTDNYDTRLYAYERSMLSTFYMPAFYGEGIRLALHAKATLSKHFTLIAKAGYTDYFDRNVISSSYRQINASHQTDIDLQLRYKF